MPVLNAIPYLPLTVSAARTAADRYVDAEIIFVDNGSIDSSYEFLKALEDHRTRTLRIKDVTISAVRNHGARATQADVIAFIDADCVIDEDHLERSLEVLDRTGCAATGSSYALPEAPHWVERTWHIMHAGRGEGPATHINGGNLICRRTAFDAIGGFNEKLTTGEDAEFCMRLRTGGFSLYASGSIVAKHLGNPKSIGAFYRKQRWHALGSFGTWRLNRFDKPLLMTFAFLVLGTIGLALPLILGVAGLVPGIVLILCVPLLATLYRAVQSRSSPAVVLGTALYLVYFCARLAGIMSVLRNRSLFEEASSSRHGVRG